MAMKEPIRVFVGSDRTQDLAVKVLEYSIRRHTDSEVVVTSMTPVRLPEPDDPRQGSRTLFSFTRFAIPRLCGYQGQAIYMDADMQVFKDIRGLANIPFDGKRVIVQEELPEEHQPTEGQFGAPARRVKQSSVMLLDCERLDWVPEDIIGRLGKEYSYEDLLYHLCILDEADVGYRVPFVWNSLETYVAGETCLIHYTDMIVQPWVSARNPNGWVWLNEVKGMLSGGALAWHEIEEEVRLGHFRPSILTELKLNEDLSKPDPDRLHKLEKIDADAKFVKHKEVYDRKAVRKKLVAEYETKLKREAAA